MCFLARCDGKPVFGRVISEKQKLPKKFLDGILSALKCAGYIHCKRGVEGGYYLAKSADEIMIGDIIRLVDGPLSPLPCASRVGFNPCDDCQNVEKCCIRAVMIEVHEAVADILDSVSLTDMLVAGLPSRLKLKIGIDTPNGSVSS